MSRIRKGKVRLDWRMDPFEDHPPSSIKCWKKQKTNCSIKREEIIKAIKDSQEKENIII